jgi:hypothetical protein
MNGHLLWFRMWSEAVDDEKLRLLAFEDRWHFVALLCCKAQGLLDNPGDLMQRKVAVKLGLQVRELDEVARRLAEVDLIDNATLQPLAWDHRQSPSDSSTERVRAWRERKRNTGNAGETLLKRYSNKPEADTEADTEAEAEKKPPNPPKQKRAEIASPAEHPSGVDPQAWADFTAHRREIRKPLTSLSATKNANILRSMPRNQQREAVNATISNCWTGLFPPKPGREAVKIPAECEWGKFLPEDRGRGTIDADYEVTK